MLLLWVKAFHIVAVVCWFAALFYLPRLFVYHAMSEDSPSRERFKVMERKLYRGIMTPSAIATVVLGGWLLSFNMEYYRVAWWIKAKLVLVLGLVCYHAACGYFLRALAEDRDQRSHIFYRFFNEIPVFLLIAIVLLAVLRPL